MKEKKNQKKRISCVLCISDGLIVLVFRLKSSMSIRNVEQGQALREKNGLASIGVFTCVAVSVLLKDDHVFLAHVDPTVFNPSADYNRTCYRYAE